MRVRMQESPFMGSITDLMTSLAVLFVLMLVLFIVHYQRELNELKNRAQTIQSLKEELKKELARAGYPAEDDPKDVLAVVYHAQSENLEFALGKSDLSDRGKSFLKNFVPTLLTVLEQQRFSKAVRSILIEGHTDSVGTLERNLLLSQERSFKVLQFGRGGCGLSEPRQQEFLDLVSIAGRGWNELVPKPGATDATVEKHDEDQDRSRRVEFIIRLKSIEQQEAVSNAIKNSAAEKARVTPEPAVVAPVNLDQ